MLVSYCCKYVGRYRFINRGVRAKIYWILACAGMMGKGRLSTGPNAGERLKRMGL